MPNQLSDKPQTTHPATPVRPAVLIGFGIAALLLMGLGLVLLPNLTGNPLYLALLISTTLLSLGSLGLTFSGLRSRLPRPLRLGLSLALWSVVALDVVWLVLPSFISGPTVQEADPFAARPPAALQTNLPSVVVPASEPATTLASQLTTVVAPTSPTTTAALATTVPTTAPTARPTTAPVTTTTAPRPTTQVAPTFLSGNFNNQGVEPVAGKATLGKTPDGKLVLRLDNLKSAPGPDLYVYLSKSSSPSQLANGLEIGKLKATQGNLNYELPANFDPGQYKSVVIYCKSFSVIFGFANLG